LTEWINAHQPDDDLDKVFVAAFEISKDPLQFRFFLTTKRILRSCPIIKNLLADATLPYPNCVRLSKDKGLFI